MPVAPRVDSPPRRRTPLVRLIRATIYDFLSLLGESRNALTGFALVMLAGTAYIRLRYGIGYAESLYETLRLLTLQSGLLFPNDPLGMALFFLVPLLGLALILDSVFRFGRLLLDKASRPEAWQVALASAHQRHVIVCGLGRVGLRVATQLLATGHEVVVVERDWNGEFVRRALAMNVPVVRGDAREVEVLRLARLARASAVVVCIDDDLLNVEVALHIRRERPDLRVILRVFNDNLDRNLEETFGPNTVFSAAALAAPTFAAAAVSRELKYVLPANGEPLGVTELVIATDSLMSGFVRTVEMAYGIRVLMHRNSTGKNLPPSPMRKLDSGDRIVCIGPLAALESLRAEDTPTSKGQAALGTPAPEQPRLGQQVIVCGLGKVGYQVVLQLLRLPQPPTVAVIYGPDTRLDFVHQLAQLPNVTMIEGDARSAAVLASAGLARAYSVVALSSDDLVNLQIGLTARRERPDVHLVMRLFSDVLAEQFEELFAIRTVYSASALAAPAMAASAVLGNVGTAFFSGTTLFSTDALNVDAGHPCALLTVEQIRGQFDALVIGLRRGDVRALLPPYEQAIAVGDELVLLARPKTLARIREAHKRAVT